MPGKKLNWGVISTANIGRWAVNPAIQASGNGELMAVASRYTQTAADFAKQWKIPKSYGSYPDRLLLYQRLPDYRRFGTCRGSGFCFLGVLWRRQHDGGHLTIF